MKQTAPNRVNAEIADVPIARLDAQDIEQSLPLREYLEQNGVAVVVNRKPAIGEAYHIICGDEDFVKETIEEVSQKNSKPLVVLLMGKKKTVHESLRGKKAKIAALWGSSIPTRDIPTIFAYFITSDDDLLYLDQGSSPMMDLKPIDESDAAIEKVLSPIMEESLLPDADRVSRIIGDMFGVKKNKGGDSRRPADGGTSDERKVTPYRSGLNKAMLLIMSVVIAPVIWYLVSLGMIAIVQWYGVNAILKADGSRSGAVAQITSFWLGQGKAVLTLMGLPARLVSAESLIRTQERVMSVAGDIDAAGRIAAELIDESRTIGPALFTKGESPLPDAGNLSNSQGQHAPLPVVTDRMRLKLDELGNALERADTQILLLMQEARFPLSLGFVQRFVVASANQIRNYSQDIAVMRSVLSLYRAAAGFDRKKTYLVILQNSMELRPTGGFIGSIAVVTVEHGMIEPPVIQDVYALDGQLKGHVDPPLPIKELLEQEHWYLRDSNWDPDFRVSGKRAAWFYEKETGQSIDGVIAVSTPLLTDLLGVIGPLDLPDYNDRVTRENFFGKSLFYTKADFFPGSTQKKDFLGSLMVALIGKLTSGNSGSTLGLMQVVSRALTRGDIQFWFPDHQAQTITQHAGWAGELIRSLPCESSVPPCIADRVTLVEANLGVNKVNALIERSVKSRVDLGDDGGMDGTIAVTYRNTSTDDTALSGAGVYLAYLRSYVTADTRVGSVNLDGEEIPPKATSVKSRTLPYRDADETSGGLTTVSVAFTVPPGMEKTLTMTYQRGIPLTFAGGETTFVLSIGKQPGTSDMPLNAAIGYPAGWNRVADGRAAGEEVQPTGFLANARELRYNTTLDQTKTFMVKFTK